MNDEASPEISVVILTPDNLATISKTLECLRNQTVREKMEVVIVAPSAECINSGSSHLKYFMRTSVVEFGEINSPSKARAAGIRNSSAPIVALAEDHSYPDRDWAEALIESHRKPWAAVGPVVSNANPETAVSWADFIIGYGPWMYPSSGGTVKHLPGHNSCYKREFLLEYGLSLDHLLEAESVLHWDLRSKGHEIYLEPGAKTSHTNFSLLSSWTVVQFHAGRVFASVRSKNWSLFKRVIYALGSPLIPFIRLVRTISEMYRPGRLQNTGTSKKIRILLALVLGLIIDGAGQFVGYSIGAGDSKQKVSKYEFHRYLHLSEEK